MDTFFFFVPYRLIRDNWKKFMGEQKNPGDSTDFIVPQIKTPVGGWPIGSLGGLFWFADGWSGGWRSDGFAQLSAVACVQSGV